MNCDDLIGKTIKEVDRSFGANVVRIFFTDGSTVIIDTEAIGYGLYAPAFYNEEAYFKQ